jgi:hypothetical protein
MNERSFIFYLKEKPLVKGVKGWGAKLIEWLPSQDSNLG